MSSQESPAIHQPRRIQGRHGRDLDTPGYRQTPANRRYTPYRKTPATRRLHKMLNKTWKAHKVSPLHKFNYSPKDLKTYGRQLATYITVAIKKGLVLLPEENPTKATFSVLKGIKQTDNDAEAVRISLTAYDKEVLVAVLCSVNIDTNYVSRPELREFTALPLLLVKGSATLTHCFSSWLQNTFDTKVSKLSLSSLSLSWMLAMWSGFHTEASRTKRPIRLVYSLPKEVVGLSRIIFDIDAADCLKVWECVHPPDSADNHNGTFLEEEMTNFIKSLEQHFYYCMKIKLSKLNLTQVGTSAAFVDTDGRLKLYTFSHCLRILAHLTQLSAEQILDIP